MFEVKQYISISTIKRFFVDFTSSFASIVTFPYIPYTYVNIKLFLVQEFQWLQQYYEDNRPI